MTIVSNKSAEFSSKEVRPDQKLCIPVVISLQQLEKKWNVGTGARYLLFD